MCTKKATNGRACDWDRIVWFPKYGIGRLEQLPLCSYHERVRKVGVGHAPCTAAAAVDALNAAERELDEAIARANVPEAHPAPPQRKLASVKR